MKKIVIAGTCLFALAALASPAPWQKWKSKLDGKTICAQNSPGDGWVPAGGPYPDSRCVPRAGASANRQPIERLLQP